MKKIVLGLIVFVLLGVAGVMVYVGNIDWNQHKDKIAKQFYNSTGKVIDFDGRVSFKIFPVPYLSAVNAKVYNDDTRRGKPLLEINDVMAELALMPLLSGEINISKMILDGAVINLDWDGNGINWQGDLSPDQRQMMEEANLVLNSVYLKNAMVNLESAENDLHIQLTNLNGEISAQSVFGPFRIEGNYLKGNSPEGFAISIGRMSDNYATPLNMVVTHPQSDSYVRFDGTAHFSSKMLNGNVVIETKKLNEFVNANFSDVKLSAEYNQPAAFGFDVALNSQNLTLSNIVVKYGETQGAGTLQMSMDNLENPEITVNFDFSDMDLEPLVKLVRKFIEKYKNESYAPEYNMDLNAEVKVLRALYKGQGLKNLNVAFSLDDDTLTIDNFNVVLPGDTNLRLKGSVYPYENSVYYQIDTSISASDFARTLKWLEIEPRVNATAVYKKMILTAKAAGNFEKIQISPYNISLDKSTFSGEAGVVLGKRTDVMLVVNADTINFDNYISSLPEEEKSKSWAERMAYRFGKLGMLNDFDMVLNAKADLIIYESMPFEKVDIKGNLLNGAADIEYCKIEQMANTSIGLKGRLGGFGSQPKMDNLQYEIKSSDIAALINKLELKVPNLDYKRFNNLNMSGAINGRPDNFGINTQATIGSLDVAYKGKAAKNAGLMNFDGNLEIKHPDFVKLLNNLKLGYEPNGKNLGLFKFKGDVKGDKNDFTVEGLDANIGYTTFGGNLHYELSKDRPNIMAALRVNRFEIDKFLQQTKAESLVGNTAANDGGAFFAKPFWSKNKIDYSPYIYADVNATVNAQEMSYKSHILKDASFTLELVDGTANVPGFKGVCNNAPVEGSMVLRMDEEPMISGELKIDDANISDFNIGGKVYNLKDGKFMTRFDFNSKADSEQSFAANLKGKAEFQATATEVGGFNLKAIYDDLIQRDNSSGLAEKVKANIASGKTFADKISGRLIWDNGKFSLADSSITTNDAEVKVYGEGNVEDWDMNVVFNVKYNEPKYLPEFSFSLKNSMDNPLVDVNVSSLFKFYKSQEEERAVAAAAAVEAEQNYWRGLVEEQKQVANDLVTVTRNKLEKEIDELLQETTIQESAARYNQLKQDISQTLAQLIEKTDSVNSDESNEEKLKFLDDAFQQTLKDLEIVKERRNEIYLGDLKKENELLYNKVVEENNALKQVMFSYNTGLDKYRERLLKIVTDYKLDKDDEFQQMKQKIDEQVEALEKLNEKADAVQDMKSENASIADYEAYNKNLKDILDALDEGKKSLSEAVSELDKYVAPKVDMVEKGYYLKIENEENQRRIEENIGSISIKRTGRTVKVVRDIEDIKNAEIEVSQEGVRVLDFSKEKIEQSKQEKNSTENIIKKGRHIRPN